MAAEPIGVMACFECVEKHSRDLEHHLEDIIRVTEDPKQRLYFEDLIDKIREIRKFAHQRAKGIAVAPPVPIPILGRVGESEHSFYVRYIDLETGKELEKTIPDREQHDLYRLQREGKISIIEIHKIEGNPEWEELEKRHKAIVEAARKLAPEAEEVEITDEEIEHILERQNPAEPIRRERGEATYVDIYHESAACSPSSHRARRTDDHVLTFCCPYGLWNPHLPAGQQCMTGMILQKIEHLHPEGQGSCPICGG